MQALLQVLAMSELKIIPYMQHCCKRHCACWYIIGSRTRTRTIYRLARMYKYNRCMRLIQHKKKPTRYTQADLMEQGHLISAATLTSAPYVQ